MNSPSLLRRQIPLFVTYGDIFPRPGEVVLWDGAFDTPENFAAMPKAPSLRELARRKLRLREFPPLTTPLICTIILQK